MSGLAENGAVLPSGRIRPAKLKAQLDDAEREFAAGKRVSPNLLLSLQLDVLECAAQTGKVRLPRRLAKLLALTGHDHAVIALLRAANRISPADAQTAFLLSDALASQNNVVEALDVLSPLLSSPGEHVEAFQRAAKLQMRMGCVDDSLRLACVSASRDPARIGGVLTALIALGKGDEALASARALLEAGSNDVRVFHAIYTALTKLGAPEEDVFVARGRLLDCAEASGCGGLWRARLLWQEGENEAAIVEIESALARTPDDPALIKERASFALNDGYWGRDAAILLKARPLAGAFSGISYGIIQADRLFRAHGSSLEMAAAEPETFAHIKTPECVFAQVSETVFAPAAAQPRSGMVMVVGSLAGGGAERILANTFRHLSQSGNFDWIKLYVSDLANETSKDFYLPLTGLTRSDVVVLNQDCEITEPLCWLPRWHSQVASRILEHLKRDRPAILHASLEPLNVLAGLAAILAGVPRIVLHTHNMRPTELLLRNASRLRDCYKALLSRPEVSLVGCARACIADYADWLGLDDSSKLHVVRNGLDTDEIIAASRPSAREDLRAQYGIGSATTVIGTAFRFAEIKQPFLWVDAAAEVAAKHSDVRFVMFGDGELRSATEEYVRSRGLREKFIFTGRVSDIYHRLPLLDLFVLSSRSEALPNTLLEAQAAGVPVVAFDVGGVAEAMIEDVTGILVKGRTAGDLAAAILSALAVPQWCTNVRNSGPEFVTTQFSVDGMLYQLRSILQSTDRPRQEKIPAVAVAA
jgi:glycosyltransferase involved in cell wall biosynthesis